MSTKSKASKVLSSPKFHACMVGVWISLLIPTLVWWSESVLWVAFMSLYANIGMHYTSYQSARTEREVKNGEHADTQGKEDRTDS